MLNLILIAGIAMLNYDGPAPGAVDLNALAGGFGDPSAWGDASAWGDQSAWDQSAWGTLGQGGQNGTSWHARERLTHLPCSSAISEACAVF